ncbi:MAG: hypothetical protein IPH31_09160 [Lewinellaceae bacterium]|nr:hypothetical protein [Lewinellaceae bacterium]
MESPCFFLRLVSNGISPVGREVGRALGSLFVEDFLSAGAVTKPGYDWEWTRTLFAYKGSGCLESILWLFKRWTPNSLISAVGITNVLLLHFLNEGVSCSETPSLYRVRSSVENIKPDY